MASTSENKVTVRVEVVVEGGQAAPVVAGYAAQGPLPRGLNIITPVSGDNTPVSSGGCISASGTSVPVGQKYPRLAWALAYPNTTEDPAHHPTPGGGAVSTPVDSGTGAWSFGQVVPGARCDGTLSGPDNNTLLVWYDYGPPGSPSYKNTDATTFHGYCAGSGSGGGMVSRTVRVGSHLLPRTFHATFTGALSALHSVTLTWDGVSWVGESAHGGGAVLSLNHHDPAFQLLAAGPGIAFVVAGQPTSLHPFHWSATGTALGASAGPFKVTITE